MSSEFHARVISLQKDGETKRELCRRMGVPVSTLKRWETKPPEGPRRIQSIAGALGCDAGWLTYGHMAEPPDKDRLR